MAILGYMIVCKIMYFDYLIYFYWVIVNGLLNFQDHVLISLYSIFMLILRIFDTFSYRIDVFSTNI